MTTYTQSDLATRVLRDLGLVDARETPDADDLAWAEQTIASVVAQLVTQGINLWNMSDEEIPEEYLVALSKRVGLDVGSAFGLFSAVEAEQAKPLAEMALRRMNARVPTGSVAEATYY